MGYCFVRYCQLSQNHICQELLKTVFYLVELYNLLKQELALLDEQFHLKRSHI